MSDRLRYLDRARLCGPIWIEYRYWRDLKVNRAGGSWASIAVPPSRDGHWQIFDYKPRSLDGMAEDSSPDRGSAMSARHTSHEAWVAKARAVRIADELARRKIKLNGTLPPNMSARVQSVAATTASRSIPASKSGTAANAAKAAT